MGNSFKMFSQLHGDKVIKTKVAEKWLSWQQFSLRYPKRSVGFGYFYDTPIDLILWKFVQGISLWQQSPKTRLLKIVSMTTAFILYPKLKEEMIHSGYINGVKLWQWVNSVQINP